MRTVSGSDGTASARNCAAAVPRATSTAPSGGIETLPLSSTLVTVPVRSLRGAAGGKGSRTTIVPRANGVFDLALAQPELQPQMLEILAGRAIYTLPYHQLLAYSRNPAEDWYLRRFEPLARAELARHGLTVERYFTPPPALEA